MACRYFASQHRSGVARPTAYAPSSVVNVETDLIRGCEKWGQ